MYKKIIGEAGEKFCEKYLTAKGFRVLKMDYRLKCGQIDIIARDQRGIHFIEVKTRTSDRFGRPALAVTEEKLKHIRNTAQVYMRENNVDEPIYIDVMEIVVNMIEGV